jgi:PASTA domain
LKVWRPKTVASKIVTGVGLVGTIIGIVLGVKALIPDPEPPQLSVVFIVDVSQAMREHLGGETKLAAAQNSIVGILTSRHGISTSLRLVTAGCGTAYTDPTIDFSKQNLDRFREAFENLAAQPVSSYFEALNSAADDLTSKNLIEDSPQKLLIAFVAKTGVTCESPFFPIGSGLVIQFFWLGSGDGLAEIRKQLNQLGFSDVKVEPVGSRKALKAAVRHEVSAQLRKPTVSTQTQSTGSTATTTETTPTTPTVPNVVGLTQTDATDQLKRDGFSADVQTQHVAAPDQQGIVLDQEPAGDSSADAGTTVKLTVGEYVAPQRTTPVLTGPAPVKP